MSESKMVAYELKLTVHRLLNVPRSLQTGSTVRVNVVVETSESQRAETESGLWDSGNKAREIYWKLKSCRFLSFEFSEVELKFLKAYKPKV